MGKLHKVERRKEQVPLFTNEDQDRLTELLDAIEEASVSAGPQRVADAPVKDAAEAYDSFLAEAVERAEMVGITALPGRKWRELMASHPPRPAVTDDEGDVVQSFPQDQREGFNVETIAQPLVVASVDLDQFDDEAEREAWVDDLDDPKFSRLYSAAVRINTRGGPDPKFSASSWLDQTSAVMSRLAAQSEAESTSSSGSPERVASSSEPTG